MSYVDEMVSHEGGCQWQIGKRTKHWGQNVSQIISQKHFTTKESTSVHNHITQLILVALTIIIRGFFFLFFLNEKRKTSHENNKNTSEKGREEEIEITSWACAHPTLQVPRAMQVPMLNALRYMHAGKENENTKYNYMF